MTLRVAHVCSWGKEVRCGLKTYLQYLLDGFDQLGRPVRHDVTRLSRYHDIDPDYLAWLADQATRHDPDVVHVQHEGGRFGGNEAAFYGALPDDVRVVTTVHNGQNLTPRQEHAIDAASDRVLVHNDHELRSLERTTPNQAIVIPHGCRLRDPPSKEAAWDHLDMDGPIPDLVVGTFGFLGPWKQIEEAVRALYDLPGVVHSHFGEWHSAGEQGRYAAQVKQKAENLLPHRHAWSGYVPDDDLPYVFGATDIMVYPNSWASESGSMSETMGAGIPVVARDIPPFNDGRPALLFDSIPELSDQVERLRNNAALRAARSGSARAWAENRSWERVAAMHHDMYRWLAGDRDNPLMERTQHRQLDARWTLLDDRDPNPLLRPLHDLSQFRQMVYRYCFYRTGDGPVLDMGCATGRYGALLHSTPDGHHMTVDGIDFLEAKLQHVPEDAYREVRCGSILDLPWGDDRYGTVVASEVLEHLPEPGAAFDEARRVLQPGGRFIVTVPTPHGGNLEHVSAMIPRTLAALAEEHGFDVLESTKMLGADDRSRLNQRTVATFTVPTQEEE